MKNKFYLIILLASSTVCGTVVLRPQVADRVSGLLGLRDKTVSPYVSPELTELSGSSMELTAITPNGELDGVAAVTPLHAMPPMFGDTHFATEEESFEGFAMSGHNGVTAGFNNNMGFDGYALSGSNMAGQEPSQNIEINFTSPPGDHNSGHLSVNPVSPGIQIDFAATAQPPVSATPASQAITQTAVPLASPANAPVGFADYVSTNENSGDAGLASSRRSNIQPAGLADGHQSGEAIALAGASFVQPDPVRNDFSDMLVPAQPISHDDAVARIIPAVGNTPVNTESHQNMVTTPDSVVAHSDANIITAVTYNQPTGNAGEYALSGALQPVPDHGALQNVNPQNTNPQFDRPQFLTPTFETPQASPPMMPAQTQPFSLTQPEQQPAAAGTQPQQNQNSPFFQPQNTVVNPSSNTTQIATPNIAPNVGPIGPPNAAGNMTANATFDPRQSQYEPEVIAEIETVFGSEMLARVGMKNVIMACDILAEVRENLENRWAVDYRNACEEMGIMPSIEEEREYKSQGMQILFEQTLDNWIELQMLCLDLSVNFPPEHLEEIKKAEAKNFDMYVMPQMMEQYGVTNRFELNEKLKSYGTTLDRKRTATIEKRLGQGWFGEIVKLQKSMLTSDDMIAYYEQNKEEKYKIIGHAEWEELAVFFSECPNEQEAYAKIVELGNRVIVQGENFADVAKQGSHGLTAYRGGERDASFGSLTTKTIEQAVFSLPVGQMSQIIRESSGPCAGFYIVRLKKRRDNGYTPFSDVQREIQNAIDEERFMAEQNRVLSELKQKYPVFKNPRLQQIAVMAANAERNAPIGDLTDRHAKLLTKAEQVAPSKKARNKRPQEYTAIAQAPQRTATENIAQANALPNTQSNTSPNAPPVNRPDTRSGNPTSTWEPGLGTTADKKGEETRKEETKTSFWSALNPFK